MNVESSVSQASSPSRTSGGASWRRRAAWLRFGVGPLAIAGFFLPWAHGPGPFAANQFTGFTLVGFAGRLQALDLTFAQGGMLLALRLAILGVVIAGAWQLLLAPAHRSHPAYPISGWYVVAAAGICVTIGVLRAGLSVPPAGLGLIAASAVLFVAATLLGRASEGEQPG